MHIGKKNIENLAGLSLKIISGAQKMSGALKTLCFKITNSQLAYIA
jgi:hypothetical protein